MKGKKIAIDFNLTIVDENNKLIPGAKESIEKLLRDGNEIFIFTANKNIHQILTFLSEVFEREGRQKAIHVTNYKPDADVFIDDKAMTFTNWSHVMQQLNQM